ncbi:MAG: ankyrin repeat domain-containing protein [Armatimonadetes bacterium]|nr:ankyrin repeat domain-containing protein [Armatimonadota bacterium]
MRATYAGSLDAVKLLLQAGADVDAKDNAGHTALNWAERQTHDAVAALLRQAGGQEGGGFEANPPSSPGQPSRP